MIKNPHAVALGKLGGKAKVSKGFSKMDPKRLSELARAAAIKRWKKPLAILAMMFIANFSAPAQSNPPFIPRWPGSDPIRYVIDSTAEPYRPEIISALRVWEAELPAGIFTEAQDPAGERTIVFRVSAFGAGNTFLAMSMYPPPLIAEPWAGDVTINSDAGWQRAEMRPLLLPLLLHEIGHSLGMGHWWFPDSVMFPNISPLNVRLSMEDRRMCRCLYAGECQ